jgi:hypothetical protein
MCLVFTSTPWLCVDGHTPEMSTMNVRSGQTTQQSCDSVEGIFVIAKLSSTVRLHQYHESILFCTALIEARADHPVETPKIAACCVFVQDLGVACEDYLSVREEQAFPG